MADDECENVADPPRKRRAMRNTTEVWCTPHRPRPVMKLTARVLCFWTAKRDVPKSDRPYTRLRGDYLVSSSVKRSTLNMKPTRLRWPGYMGLNGDGDVDVQVKLHLQRHM